MSLKESSKAIGAITKFLVGILDGVTELDVVLGFPRTEPESNLYLLLYEIVFDSGLKNVPLDKNQSPPIWLVLKYVLTAYDGRADYKAYYDLGNAIRTLQNINYIDPSRIRDTEIADALRNNPEPLKITFDEASLEVISKMLGSVDEKYQCSICFQVRPVLITQEEPPSFSLLVGINYEDEKIIGIEGIKIGAAQMRVPSIDSITEIIPPPVADSIRLEILGSNLDLENLVPKIGSSLMPEILIASNANRMQIELSHQTIIEKFSAGSFPFTIVQNIGTAESPRIRCMSNVRILHILPIVIDASDNELTIPNNLSISGRLLGKPDDSVLVSFYATEGRRSGEVVAMYDNFQEGDYSSTQETILLKLNRDTGLSAGTYRILVRINSEQAHTSPKIIFKPKVTDVQFKIDDEIKLLELKGSLLGCHRDEIEVTLTKGASKHVCSDIPPIAYIKDQTSLSIPIASFESIVSPGRYHVSLIVNSQTIEDDWEVTIE
ncbi:MAG: Pvc16 family protein [Candidatus Thorarchaeota archaeon]